MSESKIITGPAGFRFIVTGILPPSIASQPEAVQVAFLSAQFSWTAAMAGFIKTFEAQPLQLGFDGNPIEKPRLGS